MEHRIFVKLVRSPVGHWRGGFAAV
jgi:hypothetical protein